MKTAFAIAAGAGLFAAGMALPAAPALAQGQVAEIIVYGNDPCPRSTDDEIVVCARKPEAERYRIPENLREIGTPQQRESWAHRARSLEYVGRGGIMSCSPVGPGGHTGCLKQLIERAETEVNEVGVEGTPPPVYP